MRDALIIHSNQKDAQTLANLLTKRNVRSLLISNVDKLTETLAKHEDFFAALIIIDIDLSDDAWLVAYRRTSRIFPDAEVLFTTDRAESHMVLRAKAHGAEFFLRAPFTDGGLVQALKRMRKSGLLAQETWRERLPQIQVPVRIKITFPYVFLAIMIMLGASYISSRVARDSVEERYLNQLINTAMLGSDWMVREEDKMLGTLRLLLNSEGMAEAVINNNAEALRKIVLPVTINSGDDAIGILNGVGENLLTVIHIPGESAEVYNSSRGGGDYRP
ncbi:MAG: hypothetical protein N2D54_11275, partial [Chloroflexota bacterium]